MGSEVVQVKILGTAFSIRSDQDPGYINEIIQYIRGKTEEIQKSTASGDPLRVAVLAGMLITDELFQERRRDPGAPGDTEASLQAVKLTAEIIERLENSLRED
jgi:cell division protein ZapA (FtsZ GTPase activity inhibitor)